MSLSHLSVAESDREPAEVPVDDLDVVILGAGDVEGLGTAGDDLSLQSPSVVFVDHQVVTTSDLAEREEEEPEGGHHGGGSVREGFKKYFLCNLVNSSIRLPPT